MERIKDLLGKVLVERISRIGCKDEFENWKKWWQESGLLAGFRSLPSLSLSFLSPSLLSCQTRSSAGLLGAFFVPLHSSLTILPICCWVRSEIEGAKEQQMARAGEGETREVRI